jgi:hypothetical protein
MSCDANLSSCFHQGGTNVSVFCDKIENFYLCQMAQCIKVYKGGDVTQCGQFDAKWLKSGVII